MYNGDIISICICIKERLKQWVNNYIFLVPNAFHHKASTFKVFKRKKIHFTKINSRFQAREKKHFIESDGQKRDRSVILERTIYLEMNNTEFWSVDSE